MVEKDLISLGKKGNEEYDKSVRDKLKGSGSKKREIAQQVRRAKEKVDRGDVGVDDITQLISSPDCSARQIQEMIQKAGQMDMKPGEFVQLIRTVIAKHSALFGSKVELDTKAASEERKRQNSALMIWDRYKIMCRDKLNEMMKNEYERGRADEEDGIIRSYNTINLTKKEQEIIS